MPPTSGLIASPAEYDRMDGVIFEYGGGWSQTVTDCVVALTQDPQYDEIAYVVVANANTQANATTKF